MFIQLQTEAKVTRKHSGHPAQSSAGFGMQTGKMGCARPLTCAFVTGVLCVPLRPASTVSEEASRTRAARSAERATPM